MTLHACAELVRQGDPNRFAAALAAPPHARAALFPLYALNLELARAPWMSAEPMVAEMRLQWWRDALDQAANGRPQRHEVMTPLADLMVRANLPLDILDRMAEARRWDISHDPFEDQADFDAYIDNTAGGLMWLSARALGAPAAAEICVRDFAYAAGLAAYLQAVPELEARGRIPLLDGRGPAVAELAGRGLARLRSARAKRQSVAKSVAPALLAGWQAEPLLKLAQFQPQRVAQNGLHLSEFHKRARLLWQSATLRW